MLAFAIIYLNILAYACSGRITPRSRETGVKKGTQTKTRVGVIFCSKIKVFYLPLGKL
jgi:hypothetical protein